MHHAFAPSALPNPEASGFFEPAEQISFMNGALAGKTAAELAIGQALGEEHINATHDHLTGLLNRRGLEEIMAFLPPEELKNYAVLYMDGDNFKAINELISHDRGDETLALTATRVEKSLRKKSILARIGGDEFLALIYVGKEDSEHPTLKSKTQQAEGARTRIDDTIRDLLSENTDLEVLGYGLSTGIAYPYEGSTIDSLKADAEEEMKKVKKQHHETTGIVHRQIVA